MKDLSRYVINETDTIMQAIAVIDNNHMRCAIVLNDNNKVVGVVSQGDILHSLLNSINPYSLVSQVLNQSFIFLKTKDIQKATNFMREKGITLIPILSEERLLQDVITIEEVFNYLSTK